MRRVRLATQIFSDSVAKIITTAEKNNKLFQRLIRLVSSCSKFNTDKKRKLIHQRLLKLCKLAEFYSQTHP